MTTQNRPVAVITGASSGIGKAAAMNLAAQGWHVIAHGRDPARTDAAERDIRAAAGPNGKVDMIRGDLCLMADAARLASEAAALTDRIQIFLANAGGVRAEKQITPEGNEVTFAGNHLGHFLMIRRLLPQIQAAASGNPPGTARVISVSSLAHESAPPIDWDDIQMIRNWVSAPAYCLAKLYNVLFTRELARRVAADGIVANAMHPGVVDSNFANHGDAQMQSFMKTRDLIPPEDAADTLLWLATAPEAGTMTGGYFHLRQQTRISDQARDDGAAARLWTESERLLADAGY